MFHPFIHGDVGLTYGFGETPGFGSTQGLQLSYFWIAGLRGEYIAWLNEHSLLVFGNYNPSYLDDLWIQLK